MIFGVLDGLKISVGAVVGILIGYQVGHWRGVDAGYDKRIAEAAIASARAETERRGDDAILQDLSDYDLCVLGIRGDRVLDISPCDVLRGVGEE